MEKTPQTRWSIPVSISLDKALEQAILLDSHSTKSEFVREAVRRQLEKMGYNPQIFPSKIEKEIEA